MCYISCAVILSTGPDHLTGSGSSTLAWHDYSLREVTISRRCVQQARQVQSSNSKKLAEYILYIIKSTIYSTHFMLLRSFEHAVDIIAIVHSCTFNYRRTGSNATNLGQHNVASRWLNFPPWPRSVHSCSWRLRAAQDRIRLMRHKTRDRNETVYGKESCCELPVRWFHAYENGCFPLIVRISNKGLDQAGVWQSWAWVHTPKRLNREAQTSQVKSWVGKNGIELF